MALACSKCGGHNDPDATACFTCGQPLVQAIRQGQLIDGRFEIRDRLGRGGMGAVYRAYDRVLEEEVALKVLREDVAGSPEASRRFRTEIKLARKVMHRNVCRIFEYGEDAGLTYIAMELVLGTDLKVLVTRAGQLPAREAFSIAIQIADGLEAIHQVGVIHRDLKASNIMIDGQGAVRLMDFGIAKAAAEDATGATATGHVVGTPSCMSPEQARGEKVDFRSDIYSLGVVIFELFAGQPLFEGDTPVALLMKHIHEAPPLQGPRAARLPASLVPVLAVALSKAREARYPSAAAFSDALRQAMTASGGTEATAEGHRATLDVRPAGSHHEHPTEVEPRTLAGDAYPPTRVNTVVAPTVAMPPRVQTPRVPAPATRRPSPLLLGGLAVGVLAVVLFAVSRERGPAPEPPVTTLVAPVSTTLPPVVAAPPIAVRLNALPWARVKLTPLQPLSPGTPIPGDLTTPCALALAPGRYAIHLENGGLTAALDREIEVAAGRSTEFVFTMPAFDARKAAAAAAADAP